MFNKGEFEIFKNAGCRAVFYADTLSGPRMPNLTYMLTFADIDELNAAGQSLSPIPIGRSFPPRLATPTKRS
jgi:hypothetical protein